MTTEQTSLVGGSPAVLALRRDIDRAAASEAKVLLTGESGVGKEVAARLIHAGGARRNAALVSINCVGVPDTLLESEFFGHAKGSFTGAYRDKPGLLQAADRGTVFLDEVGEMSLRMQGLLLRFLETGEIQHVGGTDAHQTVNVRVIAATNRSLRDLVEARTFREDLFYRLNVIHVHVPPLRERLEDVPVLARFFLNRFCGQYGLPAPDVAPAAFEALVAHRWPGNIRELRNVVERTVIRRAGGPIAAFDLSATSKRGPSRRGGQTLPPPSATDVLFNRMVEQKESFWQVVHEPFMAHDLTRKQLRELITRGLEQTCGSYTVLAELFQIAPGDYKRFLGLLRKHQCHIPFQPFRRPMLKADLGADQDQSQREPAAGWQSRRASRHERGG